MIHTRTNGLTNGGHRGHSRQTLSRRPSIKSDSALKLPKNVVDEKRRIARKNFSKSLLGGKIRKGVRRAHHLGSGDNRNRPGQLPGFLRTPYRIRGRWIRHGGGLRGVFSAGPICRRRRGVGREVPLGASGCPETAAGPPSTATDGAGGMAWGGYDGSGAPSGPSGVINTSFGRPAGPSATAIFF